MTLPGVNINEQDGQLGVTAAGNNRLLVVVGPTTAGPINTPSTYARVKDLVARYGGGPAVEAAAYAIENYNLPVMLVRADATTTPDVSDVESDKSGTSTVTVDDASAPVDDYELALEILKGGTVGTAGATYRLSYDGGRTWSAAMALGTANSIAVPGAGVTFKLSAGTLVQGDLHAATATAASWNPTTLQDALAPLGVTQVPWKVALIVGAGLDNAAFDKCDTLPHFTNGKHVWISNTRLPTADEDEGEYRTALEPLSTAKASKDASVYAAACKLSSAISGRVYRRPVAWAVAARQASVSEEVNIADPDLGPLPGVSIRDANGNPDEHDEAINPGLDDLRFGTLRTWPRRQGVYVTLPRVFAPTGSDFRIMPHRLVMNLAHEALEDYLISILHKPIPVSRKTGYIVSAAATRIELGANAVLAAVLLAKPKASGAYFRLNRTDNLLSVPALNGGAKVLPLAYPEWINADLSFENPALQIQPV